MQEQPPAKAGPLQQRAAERAVEERRRLSVVGQQRPRVVALGQEQLPGHRLGEPLEAPEVHLGARPVTEVQRRLDEVRQAPRADERVVGDVGRLEHAAEVGEAPSS